MGQLALRVGASLFPPLLSGPRSFTWQRRRHLLAPPLFSARARGERFTPQFKFQYQKDLYFSMVAQVVMIERNYN